MRDLLFLAHRIPYPPNKGDKIRSWNIFKYLAERYRIHLGCFFDDPGDREHIPFLETLCGSSCILPLNPRIARIKSLSGLARGQPLSVPYYASADMRGWVDQTIEKQSIDLVLQFSSVMTQYAAPKPDDGIWRVVDFVDMDSDKWRQYADASQWPFSWIYRRESEKLFEYERHVVSNSDVSLFVSKAEADLFKSRAPDLGHTVHALPNGVDIEYFDPGLAYRNPYQDEGPNIVFTGAMDYWANIDAVSWFATDIFPVIRDRTPAAKFWIVGSHPASAVVKLADQQGVFVAGRVEDVRPWLAWCDVAVAPMRLARGVQNKVLEAMAMGCAVVSTPEGLEGIDVTPGKEVSCCGTVQEFAEAVLTSRSLAPEMRKISATRDFVSKRFSWSANLERINSFLDSGYHV